MNRKHQEQIGLKDGEYQQENERLENRLKEIQALVDI